MVLRALALWVEVMLPGADGSSGGYAASAAGEGLVVCIEGARRRPDVAGAAVRALKKSYLLVVAVDTQGFK